jgi:hypothetical protein
MPHDEHAKEINRHRFWQARGLAAPLAEDQDPALAREMKELNPCGLRRVGPEKHKLKATDYFLNQGGLGFPKKG